MGVDIEPEMIEFAEEKRNSSYPQERPSLSFLVDDIVAMDLEPTDFVVCYCTVQFVRPALRQTLIDKIYRSLNWAARYCCSKKFAAPTPDSRTFSPHSTTTIRFAGDTPLRISCPRLGA